MDEVLSEFGEATTSGKAMKVLIADDHELFREGLRCVLHDLGSRVVIVEASDYPGAIACVEAEQDIDLVLLDLGMPGMAWSEGIPCLRQSLDAHVPIVILSASDDRTNVQQSISLGAAGFIPKTSSGRVMISALRLVLDGGVYLPTTMLAETAPVADQANGLHGTRDGLTPRQREVMDLLARGQSNKEIARVLNLAEGTVKLHVTAILKAFNVNNRTRAVVAAQTALARGGRTVAHLV